MFYCPNCGSELTDDSKFCSYCGAKIEIRSQPRKKEAETPPIIPEEPHKKEYESALGSSGDYFNKEHKTTSKSADHKHRTKKKTKTTDGKRKGIGPVLVVLFLLILIAAGGETSDKETPESSSSLAAISSVDEAVSSDGSSSTDTTASSTADSAASFGSGSIAAAKNDNRPERNGFDSESNNIYQIAQYCVEIPAYWISETEIDGGIQRYAETGGKVAMLQITAGEDPDANYPVTFDGLMADNENIIAALEETSFKEVTSYELIDTGVVKGILYKGTVEESGVTGYGEWFTFPSETDRNWCTLVLMQSDNTDYLYTEDFMKMICSIRPIKESVGDAEADEIKAAQNLTAENCPDLAALLVLRDPADPSVSVFASRYKGRVIEFDGCVAYMARHGDYKTRWDVLLSAGDFDKDIAWGPAFHLTDVNFYDMNVTGGDSVYAGLNVHVVTEVGEYNLNSQLFELDIISMQIRD